MFEIAFLGIIVTTGLAGIAWVLWVKPFGAGRDRTSRHPPGN
jgi:hypothetical protein